MTMQLDPMATVKSSVELAAQMGGSGEKLKEALDAAKDISQVQRVTTPIVDGLLARLRTAFAAGNRSLPADYLETTVHRTMLEERKYLSRSVLGGNKVLGYLAAGGAAGCATYLPEEIAALLPVMQKFRVRLIAEPHPAQHPADGEGPVLLALAVGRVIGQRGRSGY
jgi:hypothetical protein